MNWTPHPMFPIPSKAEVNKLVVNPDGSENESGLMKLEELWRTREKAIEMAETEPLDNGFEFPAWKLCDEFFDRFYEVWVLGGNGCLAEDERIYDPVDYTTLEVSKRDKPFHVWAWDSEKHERVIAKAEPAFRKPDAMRYRVELGYDYHFCVSGNHRVLTTDGYKTIHEIKEEKSPFLLVGGIMLWGITPESQGQIWDFSVPGYKNYWHNGCFHHNSSKTEYAASRTVRALMQNPGAKIYCFSQDNSSSINVQQAAIFKYLPTRFKGAEHKTSRGGYVRYTPKNGFTAKGFFLDMEDGTAIRECHFATYSAFFANRIKFEGFEYGSRMPSYYNIGAWLDEYLLEDELYNTLLYRIVRRNANMLTTFTPVKGYTPFVGGKLNGSIITATQKTNPRAFSQEGDPRVVELTREKVYSKDEPKSGVGITYFPSEQNPWSGFNAMISIHGHKTLDERLIRFHGIPRSSERQSVPLFSEDLNILKFNEPNRYGFRMPAMEDIRDRSKFTIWQLVDPASLRNYATSYFAVSQDGLVYLFREWPDEETYGPWALPGDKNWLLGPAQPKVGYDVAGYVRHFQQMEEEMDIKVAFRIGDCRYFAREQDNCKNLFEEFAENGLEFESSDPSGIKAGRDFVDSWFSYNKNGNIDGANRPRFYVHESCKHTVQALKHYQGLGVKDEALKDFFDNLRMARMHEGGDGIQFIPEDRFQREAVVQTGGY